MSNPNWEVDVYNEAGDITGSWVIENRTEDQARKEAEADVNRCDDVDDWTLTEIS